MQLKFWVWKKNMEFMEKRMTQKSWFGNLCKEVVAINALRNTALQKPLTDATDKKQTSKQDY